MKAAVTSVFGRVLKIDSTEKIRVLRKNIVQNDVFDQDIVS